MIHELLGGPSPSPSSLLGGLGDTKISINGAPLHHHFQTPYNNTNLPPSTSPSPTTSTTPSTNTTTNPTSSTQNKNSSLRCPRCDSANTKFCYYNNYNLTQPRHFCKTCRRYWTKGGALRNVPIGGGCRKNKTTIVTSSKSTTNKFLKTIPPEIGRIGLDFDHDLIPSNPNNILWGSSTSSSSPQSSHLLALLRATTQNPNPNHNPNHMMINNSAQSQSNVGQQLPSLSNNQQQNGSLVGGDVGMQELYQRLIRSSTTTTSNYLNNHNNSHSQPVVLMSNVVSSSSSVLESAPLIGGGSELGYGWNPAFSWSDLPTTNGAYP